MGIDQAELQRQRSILGEITGIDDIDFREGKWSSETHSISGLHEDERFDLVMCTAFAQHISDPLHLFRELSNITGKALLLHTAVGGFNSGMGVSYIPGEHHEKWGDMFPNNFDTAVSPKLLEHSLRQCGFKEIIKLKYSWKWLPWLKYYRVLSTVVCLK